MKNTSPDILNIRDPSSTTTPLESRVSQQAHSWSPGCVSSEDLSVQPDAPLLPRETRSSQGQGNSTRRARVITKERNEEENAIDTVVPLERDGETPGQILTRNRDTNNITMPIKVKASSNYSQNRGLSRRSFSHRPPISVPFVRTIPTEEPPYSDPSNTRNASNYNFIGADSLSPDSLVSPPGEDVVHTKVYKRRFWILFIYCVLSWFACVQWNAWGPISESLFAVFKDWSTATVAMMETWVTMMFVFAVLPVCWLTGRIGLRLGILISALLLAIGLALRCISDKSPSFTTTSHICAILLGLSLTLILSAPPMIASVWFPPNERTSALSVIMAVSQLGCVGSYLEPLLVRSPAPNVPVSLIKKDIMRLLYAYAGIGGIVFLMILAYFPSRPPLPPSISSSTERLNFKNGFLSLCRNRNFIVVVLLYGFASGPSLGWIGVLNFSLKPLGFNQDSAMYVGLAAVVSCFVVTMVTGWLTDRLYGHLRETIIFLLVMAAISYYWFLLISAGILPNTKWQVFMSVSLGLSLNFATIPLFFEMAVEIAYPVPEVLVGGVVTASDSLSSSLFLVVYMFESLGFSWVSYVLIASNALPVLLLLFVRADYTRANLDSPASTL